MTGILALFKRQPKEPVSDAMSQQVEVSVKRNNAAALNLEATVRNLLGESNRLREQVYWKNAPPN